MDSLNTCPLFNPNQPTGGYFKHRRRGEPACATCRAAWSKRINENRIKQGGGRRVVKTWQITCAYCGGVGQVSKPDAQTCSFSCRSRLAAGWASPSAKSVEPWQPPPAPKRPRKTRALPVVLPPSGGVFINGPCARCGQTFTALTFNGTANYCSTQCSKADVKDRRRARKRDAYVAPVYRSKIFERDGWRCQLCGKQVRRTATAPHSLAPVLDHIVPLAAGGTHEPANVQCAHFLCNSIKSDRAANDQLRLIG